MDYARSDFLFQGPVASHTVDELLFGFTSNITDRLNTGLVSEGNIYYSSSI